MIEQSEELTHFYYVYRGWLNRGAVENEIFSRRSGLCLALDKWNTWNRRSNEFKDSLNKELNDQFKNAGLNHNHPFSNGTHESPGSEYMYECDRHITHLNRKRIKWVEDHCND